MSAFFVELWESIFTPGPTPTILRATNVTFAALQLVLLLMLAATYSIHCVVLSVLCAGLWWSVNWFAAELKAVQEAERAREEREGVTADNKDKEKRRRELDTADSDTEVELDTGRIPASADAVSSVVEVVAPEGELKKRGEDTPAGTQSSASTEDEWEKVSESEKEKDK
ncbi:unnamed protein product [Clonostachys chloroleuca]|uniref:V-type ATPase assembly factor pkr1 n=1 Tax=Clonostachys chloroleuca TaxID=1926264 RepID=A0AA35MFD6_9HYPO|nr:unnamed protein product [Clonostachys chloroleuca]